MDRPADSISEFFSRIRRNHGLEHATIHVLSANKPRTSLIGRSDSKGFFLYADLPIEVIEKGVYRALERLRAGEHRLAIHPNCGTNLLTAGILSGGAAFVSLQGSKDDRFLDRVNRLPIAILGAVLGLIVAQPLGAKFQKHITTQGDPGDLEIVSIEQVQAGNGRLYRILTRG